MLTGPFIEPKGKVTSAVILLHGLGADGENLIGIGAELALQFPETVFLSPNAPFGFDMMPGFAGFQWFSLTDWSPRAMLEGANKAAPTLNGFIDEVLEKYKLPTEKLALVGFSQGTMMALHVGLRRQKKIGGIVGFSGALIAPELAAKEVKSKPPICLVHGQMDMVVPFPAMNMAAAELEKAGLDVQTHARPFLDHAIDQEGIKITSKFLKACLK